MTWFPLSTTHASSVMVQTRLNRRARGIALLDRHQCAATGSAHDTMRMGDHGRCICRRLCRQPEDGASPCNGKRGLNQNLKAGMRASAAAD